MNEKKAKALELLIKGNSITSIAEEIGVGRCTIYRWINNDEEFREAKKKSEDIILDNLYVVALTELEELLYNGSNYEKIQCATQILKYKKANDVNVKVEKAKTVDEILAELM
ncbi:Uncharacterised protein [Clostridioides difficile]|uniref:Homeodomain-like n=1 Tax=Romboutsia ilealis TaxID=1115758 RepID=A0A1V1I4G5_9FIRM|nr:MULTISPECIES: helix-turn-helix domain-containing protein [Peptostreptococcaceae]CED95115.1 Homeodomain-like [Romboutsia ilealis]SJP68485.1 Uncharacterised protein [Clostridioides difficile]